MKRPLLEIIALGPDDALAADRGGADRLEVVTDIQADGLAPEPQVIEAIRRRTDLAVRVMLRLSDGFMTSPAELNRLTVLARDYAAAGAEGFVFGFLTETLEIDLDATRQLAEALDGRPWTFHRAIDHALDTDRAWEKLRAAQLPGLDAVLSAGSARGAEIGAEELQRRARANPEVARLLLAGGGLQPEHVPWLAQAGIRAFHVGSSVRPDGSWKAFVDSSYVRAWRTLVDSEVERAETITPAT